MKRFLHSLKFRMLLPVALISLGMTLALTWILSATYTRTILSQEEEKTSLSFSMVGSAVSESLKTAQTVVNRLILEPDIAYYAIGKFTSNLDMIRARQKCVEIFSKAIQQQPCLYGILLVREDRSVFGSMPYCNVFLDESFDRLLPAGLLETVFSNVGQTEWLGPLPDSELYSFALGKNIQLQDVLIGVRRVYSSITGTCYALALINAEPFVTYLDFQSDGNSGVYLLSPDGSLLAKTSDSGVPASESLAVLSGAEGKGQLIRSDSGDSLYVIQYRIPGCGWILLKEIPMETYQRTARQLQTMVWLVALAVFLVALFFYFRWLKKYMATFSSLKEGIQNTTEGKLSTRLEKAYAISEFDDIRNRFNTMNQSLENLMDTTRKMERDQLELLMRNLQTQLSPHMILNSITAIRWIASMQGADNVSDMLMELSEMLRPVLREWRVQWTLKEELDHLQHYIRLLDLRFRNHFRLECGIPEEYGSVLLPRFTLQPLVENACEHGGRPRDALVVRICAEMKDGWMRMTIQNNGKDITHEEIDRIHETLKSGEYGNSIGIYNVYSRLAICMGKESELKLEQPEEGGTRVVIRWPVRQQQSFNS